MSAPPARQRESVATVLATLPAEMRRDDRPCRWSREVLGVDHVGSFFEGPCVDDAGGVYLSDLAHGRILYLNRNAEFTTVVDYGGHPNGLALHADGRLFVADYSLGLLTVDIATGVRQQVVDGYRFEPFRGLSDLVFSGDGTLYFSDQGQSDLRRPTGRVFAWSPSGGLRLLMDGIPSPNGVALSPGGGILYLAVTRANCVYRIPLLADGSPGKVGIYLHLSGGHGPDGLAVGADGSLAVAHYGLGVAHVFDPLGRLVVSIRSPTGNGITNVAFGTDAQTLLATEAHTGSVLSARAPIRGLALFGSRTFGSIDTPD
jgi:gluconolactonase